MLPGSLLPPCFEERVCCSGTEYLSVVGERQLTWCLVTACRGSTVHKVEVFRTSVKLEMPWKRRAIFSIARDWFVTHVTFTTKVGVSFVYHMDNDAPEVDSFSRECYQALSSAVCIRWTGLGTGLWDWTHRKLRSSFWSIKTLLNTYMTWMAFGVADHDSISAVPAALAVRACAPTMHWTGLFPDWNGLGTRTMNNLTIGLQHRQAESRNGQTWQQHA